MLCEIVITGQNKCGYLLVSLITLFFQNNLGDWMISNISSNKLGHSWRLSFGLFFMACLWVETKVI